VIHSHFYLAVHICVRLLTVINNNVGMLPLPWNLSCCNEIVWQVVSDNFRLSVVICTRVSRYMTDIIYHGTTLIVDSKDFGGCNEIVFVRNILCNTQAAITTVIRLYLEPSQCTGGKFWTCWQACQKHFPPFSVLGTVASWICAHWHWDPANWMSHIPAGGWRRCRGLKPLATLTLTT